MWLLRSCVVAFWSTSNGEILLLHSLRLSLVCTSLARVPGAGQSYGLIAANISHDLSNGTGYPTFDAYVSTSPAQWGQGDDHFCCARWRMGCLTKENHGVLDPVAPSANGSAVQVHGWAWSEAARKGGWAPVQVIVSVDTAKNVTVRMLGFAPCVCT